MAPNASDGRAEGSADEAEISDQERDEIVEELIDDMAQLFRGYVRSELSFEDLSFELYDSLRTLNALATGDVIIEYEEELDGEYDEFDELAGEPTGESSSASRSKPASGDPPSRPGHKPKGRK